MEKLSDLLVQALNRTEKQDSVIISLVRNQIVKTFIDYKNLNISKYIISITRKQNIFIVKTSKPILNQELISINKTILYNIYNNLDNTWIKIKNILIKYK